MTWADDYVDVASRLAQAFDRYRTLRITEDQPQIRTVGDRVFIEVRVTVYRTPDDPVPVTAHAWEPFPGRTPYTRDSEMMVGSTSALGRALAFMGFAGKRSIASADEVRTAKERQAPPAHAKPAQNATQPSPTPKADAWYREAKAGADDPGDGRLEAEYEERRILEHRDNARQALQPPAENPNGMHKRIPTPKQSAMFHALVAKLGVSPGDYPHATAYECSRSIDRLKALEREHDRPSRPA